MCWLRQVRCGIEQLPANLSGLSRLQLLDLRGNTSLTVRGGAALAAAGGLADLAACTCAVAAAHQDARC